VRTPTWELAAPCDSTALQVSYKQFKSLLGRRGEKCSWIYDAALSHSASARHVMRWYSVPAGNLAGLPRCTFFVHHALTVFFLADIHSSSDIRALGCDRRFHHQQNIRWASNSVFCSNGPWPHGSSLDAQLCLTLFVSLPKNARRYQGFCTIAPAVVEVFLRRRRYACVFVWYKGELEFFFPGCLLCELLSRCVPLCGRGRIATDFSSSSGPRIRVVIGTSCCT
jgi:hypothetical protein